MTVEPVVAIVVANLVLGQQLTVFELAGGAGILVAVVLVQLPQGVAPERVPVDAG
jgi:drug/metabolite transporter (DMT)-like permease